MYKAFFGKILLSVLPFFCIIVVFTDISIKKGQIIPPRLAFSQQQANHDLIYRPAWSRSDEFYYKFIATRQLEPDVLLIGSSRIQAWRPEHMFVDESRGYNASVTSAEPIEFAWFIEALERYDSLPEVLIISIDHQFFNADGDFIRRNRVENVTPPFNYNFSYMFNGFREVARSGYIIHPRRILDFYQTYTPSHQLGIVARDTGRGYRYDGSYTFPNVADVSGRLIELHQESFDNAESIFEHGNRVDEASVEAMNTILEIAERNDVIVVGLMLPYHSENYRETLESGNYSFIPLVTSRMNDLFAQYEMPLLDFTDAETVGGSDDEMYDYWHAGEVLSLRTYRQTVLELPDILMPYSDIDAIEDIINNANNRFNLP